MCVMAVGGKSALHSAGDVAQSEMEAQRVLACVSTAKCAKCQNMRHARDNKADFPPPLVGLWWLTVVVPLLVSHIKGNEEKASYRAGCDSSQLTAAPVTRHARFRETSTRQSLIIHLNTLTT